MQRELHNNQFEVGGAKDQKAYLWKYPAAFTEGYGATTILSTQISHMLNNAETKKSYDFCVDILGYRGVQERLIDDLTIWDSTTANLCLR